MMVNFICELAKMAYLCGNYAFLGKPENPCVASSILAGTTIGKAPKKLIN